MPSFSNPAIILRRVEFGDYDLILSFLTRDKGKYSAIAKSARKSTKRFSGILEPFSILRIVCSTGRRRGLPVLQEAALKKPLPSIRTDIIKTAYASYWAELIDVWLEEGQNQIELFRLFQHVLEQLDQGSATPAVLGILFQVRFLIISGHRPSLKQCGVCRRELDAMTGNAIQFDLAKGGLVCDRCSTTGRIKLARGTIKQLQWLEKEQLSKAGRIRFSAQAVAESQKFLEAFVPYHLGKEPRSLKFLKQIRET